MSVSFSYFQEACNNRISFLRSFRDTVLILHDHPDLIDRSASSLALEDVTQNIQ